MLGAGSQYATFPRAPYSKPRGSTLLSGQLRPPAKLQRGVQGQLPEVVVDSCAVQLGAGFAVGFQRGCKHRSFHRIVSHPLQPLRAPLDAMASMAVCRPVGERVQGRCGAKRSAQHLFTRCYSSWRAGYLGRRGPAVAASCVQWPHVRALRVQGPSSGELPGRSVVSHAMCSSHLLEINLLRQRMVLRPLFTRLAP